MLGDILLCKEQKIQRNPKPEDCGRSFDYRKPDSRYCWQGRSVLDFWGHPQVSKLISPMSLLKTKVKKVTDGQELHSILTRGVTKSIPTQLGQQLDLALLSKFRKYKGTYQARLDLN